MKRITVVLAIFTLLFIAVAPSYAKERPPAIKIRLSSVLRTRF